MKFIAGKYGSLGEGKHSVKIREIDLSEWELGRLIVVFRDAADTPHTERIFTTYNDEYSIKFVAFLEAIFGANIDDAYELLNEAAANEEIGESVFIALRHCELKIMLRQTEGAIVESGERGVVIKDCSTGLYLTDDHNRICVFSTAREARSKIRELGIKPSYTNVVHYEGTNNDNWQLFHTSISGIKAAAQAIGDTRRIFNPRAFRETATG